MVNERDTGGHWLAIVAMLICIGLLFVPTVEQQEREAIRRCVERASVEHPPIAGECVRRPGYVQEYLDRLPSDMPGKPEPKLKTLGSV